MSKEIRKCEKCGSNVNEVNKFCPKCGIALHIADNNQSLVLGLNRDEKIGNQNHKKTTRKYLGFDTRDTTNRKPAIILSICAGIAVVALVLTIIVPHGDNKEKTSQKSDYNFGFEGKSFNEKSNEEFALFGYGEISKLVTDSATAIDSLNCLSTTLGFEHAANSFTVRSETQFDGWIYYSLGQVQKDIPVFGRGMVLVVNEEGTVVSVSGNYADVSQVATEPKVSESDAISAARIYCLAEHDHGSEKSDFISYGLLIYSFGNDPILCYLVSAKEKFVFSESVFVDAIRGDVIALTDNEYNYSGQDRKEYSNLPYTELMGTKYMQDAGRNIDYYSFGYTDDKTHICTLDENNKAAIDAMVNVSTSYDFYKTILQRTGTDGKGSPFLVYVSAIDDNQPLQARAFGEHAILSSMPSEFIYKMNYGGLFSKYPPNEMTLYLDIMAHEYTHCVTNSIRPLVGAQGEAINEALSDIMGQIIERWEKDKTDWVIANRDMASDSSKNHKYSPDAKVHDNALEIDYVGYKIGSYFLGDEQDPKDKIQELSEFWYGVNLRIPSNCTFEVFAAIAINQAEMMRINGQFINLDVTVIEEAFEEVGITPMPMTEKKPYAGPVPSYEIEEIRYAYYTTDSGEEGYSSYFNVYFTGPPDWSNDDWLDYGEFVASIVLDIDEKYGLHTIYGYLGETQVFFRGYEVCVELGLTDLSGRRAPGARSHYTIVEYLDGFSK